MKKLPLLKRSIFAIFLLSVVCFFVSCYKTDVKIIPGKYNPNPVVTGGTGNTGGNGSTTDSTSTITFSSPDDVAVDAAGNLYIADYGNNLIRKITPAGIVSTVAGNGTIGAVDATGTLASFNGPAGIAIDVAGNIYVADSGNNLIRKITSGGVVSTLAGTRATADTSNTVTSEPVFLGPSGVAVDASGNVYVANSGYNTINKVSPAGVVTTLAGNGNSGSADGVGANATFNNPTGVAVDGSGNVYVADFLNSEIRKVTTNGTVTTLAGSADTVGSANGTGSSALFYFPNSLTVDASGNVFVTDDINNLIREVSPAGVVTTVAGSGSAGSANGIGTAASFNDPSGIAVDATGNLYIADADNNLIRKVSAAGLVTNVAGTLPGTNLRHIPSMFYARTGHAFVHKHTLKISCRK
ncbi:MAG: NHL repeat-containing protein [Sphingobacteriales bacterium]